jgi:hypothetical protein
VVSLYRGGGFKGLAVGDSAAFEEWATLVRERLRRQLMRLLLYSGQWSAWR